VVSIAVHVAVIMALALIPQEKLREVVSIALQEAPKQEAKPQPPKPPPRPAEAPARAQAPRAPRAAAPQPAAAAVSPTAGFADLGLTLDSSSSDGLAVHVATAPVEPKPVAAAVATVVKPKVLVAKKPAREEGPPPKPRPLGIVRPTYTEEARRAHIEGRVLLELSVDDEGTVTAARVLSGLGYGLDEAAVAAAKNLRFAAATSGGRAVSSRFILAMRFVLGS
jgi:protein TonB